MERCTAAGLEVTNPENSTKTNFIDRSDRYFRSNGTLFDKLASLVSSSRGETYLNSRVKKLLDLSIAVPAAIISTPAITVLGIAKKKGGWGICIFCTGKARSTRGRKY